MRNYINIELNQLNQIYGRIYYTQNISSLFSIASNWSNNINRYFNQITYKRLKKSLNQLNQIYGNKNE